MKRKTEKVQIELPELPPVVIIAGPTASGKSALALQAALRFNGEIINADSMQVYRELAILTARPSAADEAQVPHHLYGTLAASEPCSAGRWLEMAIAKINELQGREKLPILCGGTGLYLKILREGIAEVPDVPTEALAATEALYKELGGEAFLDRLSVLDPASAARLVASDRQRLVRAYSVAIATGKPLSTWHDVQSASPPLNARFLTLHLMPERAALYEKIDRRFAAMFEGGGLEEIERLKNLGLAESLPAMKALGVPEILAYLAGEMDRDQALAQAQKTTRNLAKRQMTWFRNQSTADQVLTGFGPDASGQGLQTIEDFLSVP